MAFSDIHTKTSDRISIDISNISFFLFKLKICVSALKHNAQNQKQELRGKNTMVFNSSVKHCTEITTIKLHSIDP